MSLEEVDMLFDTDVLIWMQKGNEKAINLLEKDENPQISIFTYMELLQCAKNKKHHKVIRSFLKDADIKIVQLSDKIGQRAAIYVEEYGLSHSMRAGDAIIAATSIESSLPLCTSNRKHFSHIKELDAKWLIL